MKTIKVNQKAKDKTAKQFVIGVMKAHGVEYKEEETDGKETLDGKPLDGLIREDIIK